MEVGVGTDVLVALGVTVVEVEGLASQGCWVKSQRVLLIRADLRDDEQSSVLDWATQAACRPGIPHPRQG